MKISIPLSFLVLISPLVALVFETPIPLMPHVTPGSPLYNMTIVEYLKFRIPKLMFEVWPWYWSVFKWLGVVLPINVLRIITRVGAVLAVGVAIEIIKQRPKYLFFFLLTSITFVIYLVGWDYRLMQSIGYSHGLQGRYLFPNIIPHMAILIFGAIGLSRIFPHKKSKYIFVSLLVCLMVTLNIVAYITLITSYQ